MSCKQKDNTPWSEEVPTKQRLKIVDVHMYDSWSDIDPDSDYSNDESSDKGSKYQENLDY